MQHTTKGAPDDEQGHSADEQEREWERVHSEIAASLDPFGTGGRARSVDSGTILAAGQPPSGEGTPPQTARPEATPSTRESAARVPPNVAREIVRWESRNVMGLDHQLAALAEGNPPMHYCCRYMDARGVQIIDIRKKSILLQGPLSWYSDIYKAPFPDLSDPLRVAIWIDGCATGAVEGDGKGRAVVDEQAGHAPEETLSLELLDQLFERDLAGGESVPPGPMESQCVPKPLPLADAWEGTEVSNWEGTETNIPSAQTSPTQVADKLPFSPGSRLFAAVAARAAAPLSPAQAQVPLDSDLKPQRLSPAFGEAAACVLPAPFGAGLLKSAAENAGADAAHWTLEGDGAKQAASAYAGELRGEEDEEKNDEVEAEAATLVLAARTAVMVEPGHSVAGEASEFM